MKSKSFTLKNWLIPVSTGTHAASYIEVIVVKTSGEIIEIKVGNDNLSDVRNIIGGKCEAIMMGNLGFCFVNAEGERLGLPVNHKASGILHRALKKPIEIVGDAVFMSYADKNGDYVNNKAAGRMQAIVTAATGLSYQIDKTFGIFIIYQQRIQFPFVKSYVPLLPYNSLFIGVQKSIRRNHKA